MDNNNSKLISPLMVRDYMTRSSRKPLPGVHATKLQPGERLMHRMIAHKLGIPSK